jgi:hypothetical protein
MQGRIAVGLIDQFFLLYYGHNAISHSIDLKRPCVCTFIVSTIRVHSSYIPTKRSAMDPYP